MSAGGREEIQRRERARAAVRSVFLGELAEIGRRRARALRAAEAELDQVAKVLPDALAGGLQLSEIARVTGLSRPTLYAVKDRYADRPGGVTLAVLAALAAGVQTPGELAELIGRPVGDALDQLERDGEVDFIADEVIDDSEDGPVREPVQFYVLTDRGLRTLEDWNFDQAEAEAEAQEEAEALAEQDADLQERAEAEAEAYAEAEAAEDGPD